MDSLEGADAIGQALYNASHNIEEPTQERGLQSAITAQSSEHSAPPAPSEP